MNIDPRNTIIVSAGPRYEWYQYLPFDERRTIYGQGFIESIM